MKITENTDKRFTLTGPHPAQKLLVGLVLLAFGIILVAIAPTLEPSLLVAVFLCSGIAVAGIGMTFLIMIGRVRLTLDADSQTATLRWTGRMKRHDSTHAFSDVSQIVHTTDSDGEIANIALVLTDGARVPFERIQDQCAGAEAYARLANAWLSDNRRPPSPPGIFVP